MLIYTHNGTIAEIQCPECNKGIIRGYLGTKARCNICGYGIKLGKQRKRPLYTVIPRQMQHRRHNSSSP